MVKIIRMIWSLRDLPAFFSPCNTVVAFHHPYELTQVWMTQGQGDKGDFGVADGLLVLAEMAVAGLFLMLKQEDRRRPSHDTHHIWSPHLYWCLPTSQLANTHVHTPTHTALISSDSAHIQLGPTVLVHVTDHKQNIHSSTGHTPQDTGRGYPRNTTRQGCGECVLEKCAWSSYMYVCVREASREGEQMPAGHVISLTLGQSQWQSNQWKQRNLS